MYTFAGIFKALEGFSLVTQLILYGLFIFGVIMIVLGITLYLIQKKFAATKKQALH